jgi:glucose/arabinose dehydrogenase
MPKRSFPLAAVILCLAFLAGCTHMEITSGGTTSGGPSGPPPQLALSAFVAGLTAPVGFEIAPNDPLGRIFIVEQAGRIRVIQNGVLQAGPFLDITGKVESGGEMGLLGLAFHPNFGANSRFYVHYTQRVSGQLQSVIAEYAAFSPTSSAANATSELIAPFAPVDQPADNHNGGQLAFGPDDGLLYIGLGDGGNSNDPLGNGQNRNALLGKILRVGVDPFFIPPDNPLVGVPNTRSEIWAYGLRNPWRFSFDRTTGRLFAGDVGQGAREEVDLITKGGNFGWNIMEGSICRPPATTCNMANLIPPISDYDHSAAGGTSVIGGFVYRGTAIPALVGTYIFGDLSSGHVWGLKQDSSGAWIRTVVLEHNRTVSAFGQDAAGELYLVDNANGAAGNGAIFRLVAAPP